MAAVVSSIARCDDYESERLDATSEITQTLIADHERFHDSPVLFFDILIVSFFHILSDSGSRKVHLTCKRGYGLDTKWLTDPSSKSGRIQCWGEFGADTVLRRLALILNFPRLNVKLSRLIDA